MRTFRTIALGLAIAAPISLAVADKAKGDGLAGHPNLQAAQKLAAEAFVKLEAAQKANEYDLGGHAQKAKDLLKQANDEIKLAADAANDKKGR